jgi:hypothetical protein
VTDPFDTVREHERFMWAPEATTEERRASAKDFDAALASIEEMLKEAEVVARDNGDRAEAAEREAKTLREALNLALMHLEDSRAIAAVRAALASGEDKP